MNNCINSTQTTKQMVGSRIKKARDEKDLSRIALAKEMCSSPKASKEVSTSKYTLEELEKRLEARIRQWESGANPVDIEWIPAICEVLSCDIGYLFGEYKEKTQANHDICKVTGLSESAINTLRKCDENVVKFISYLLESASVIPVGLKVSQCIDTKLEIKHYQTDVFPKLSIPAELVEKAIKEWDFSDEYIEIQEKRTKVLDELKRLDTEYTALLWRCNQGMSTAIEAFIDKEVKVWLTSRSAETSPAS